MNFFNMQSPAHAIGKCIILILIQEIQTSVINIEKNDNMHDRPEIRKENEEVSPKKDKHQ